MAVFDAAELAFREEVADLLRSRTLGPWQYFRGRGGDTRLLYQELGERGWLSLSWPIELGGGGRPITYDYLLWDTLAEFRAARPDLGPGIVAHAIANHGTAEQRARYLPELRSGTVCYALGYSEPDAGSDLRGVRTRAMRDGELYRVVGEKCWTSDAQHADYLWLLCRTGEPASRARGLTLLVVPMNSDGITVTPIETMDGHRLNSVFLDDVVVSADARIGDENEAWDMIREALAVERHLQVLPGRLRRDVADLGALCARLGGNGDSLAVVDEFAARVRQVEASSLATLAAMVAGRPAVVEAARTKYLGSILAQDIPRAALDLAGVHGMDAAEPCAFLWRQSFMETIAGGSVEIMLSIIAEQELGLARAR
ncbi:acyl-CoA dehydrogenase family protein [Desertimonas flava]|uniref:acyl-CoA dehydrogenase family protein n=1 Tax=Desertimonas flava TaxID=2064846 RepID=UPI000E349AA5|nr:acyl-CoA dehydrogenase family protein [Desertimonas flava]